MKKTDREGETLRAKGQGKTVSFCAWAARCGYQLVCVCGESTVPTFERVLAHCSGAFLVECCWTAESVSDWYVVAVVMSALRGAVDAPCRSS